MHIVRVYLSETVHPEYERFQATVRFQSLDGLRALSVLAVIGHHVCARFLVGGFVSRGFLGVWIFFAISGFLITTLLLREKARYGDISLRSFYIKRSLRIFPLYYTVLAAYAVLVLLVERHQPAGQEFFRHLPYFATYTSNWFVLNNAHVVFYFAWSLATEEQFYMLWPWVEKFVSAGAVYVVSAMIFIHLASVDGLLTRLIPHGSRPEIMLSYISVPLCFGVLLAHALHRRGSFELIRPLLYPRYAGLFWLSLFLLLVALWPSIRSGGLQETLVSIPVVLLVGSCVIREDHIIAPILHLRPLVSCGVVSYGMYLMHMLCINMILPVLQRLHLGTPLPLFLASSLVVYAVAAVSFYKYESWFLARKKNLDRGRKVSGEHDRAGNLQARSA